eukprot:CAMPEP_0119135010 /NCGR_PEP_ID=MMETSP1310-20130426/18442_1 /TAXON_ID=464262 /ORGANISM="Genus nov. species nov., Strain RCC2339" /LENGTH=279 /DNA_ID=CAMNT_0007125857 /DNA_START=22 /DNA_END=861 /DNA_ORIENTATION=-
MLYLIGLGLGDHKDITVRGLEAVKSADRVLLEHYTSILGVDHEQLEEFYGKKVILADRDIVESQADAEILDPAKNEVVAFLVVGDPFGATTHSDLVVRARDRGIKVEVIHNASIMNAIGCCGLQLYRFGETISQVFWTDEWRPDSYYDKIKSNRQAELHTLCLLDIKVKEQSVENLLRGRKIFEPPRYMTIAQACQQLLEIEENRKEGAYTPETICVGLARIGQPTQQVQYGTMAELAEADFGAPLHSLVITGKMHFLEEDFLHGLCGSVTGSSAGKKD